MVSTPELCTNNILMITNPYMSTKNPSARKSLCQFSETLYIKNNTYVHRLGADKKNPKAIKTGNLL